MVKGEYPKVHHLACQKPGSITNGKYLRVLKNEVWRRRERIKTPTDVWSLSKKIVMNFTLVYIHNLYNSLAERRES